MRNFPFVCRIGNQVIDCRYTVGQGIGLYSSWALLALTNHRIIRISAARIGIRAFSDYIVLGDDVVIADEKVAIEYRKVIESIGVFISEHKSIVPSDLIGLEFASKLIRKEGNLSPLPIVLLRKKGLVFKIQFLTSVVDRLVTSGSHDSPNLDHILKVVFGPRLIYTLGDLFCRYYVFSKYSKIAPNDITSGVVPELLLNLNRIPQFEHLSSVFNTCRIENIIHCLSEVNKFILKNLEKATRELRSEIQKDYYPDVSKKLNDLRPGTDLHSLEGYTSFCVNFTNYINGPTKSFFMELLETVDKLEQVRGVDFYDGIDIFNKNNSHESYSLLDMYLDRDSIKLLDSLNN